jgi:DNA-binding MarR family transcriptional regulator
MVARRKKIPNGRTDSLSPAAFDLETYVPYVLNRVGTALVDRFVDGLKKDDLTLPMWRVMAILFRRGPTRFGVLGGLSLIEPPTLARLLAILSERGLISRTRSPVDGRGTLVKLSAEGRATVHSLIPWAESVSQYTLAGMSPDEAEFFKRLLLRVCAHVAPSPPESE